MNMKTRYKLVALLLGVIYMLSSCNYLDVVPDGVSDLDNAFTMRNQAKKYLYTCYSYMPKDGHLASDPGILGGDELWTIEEPIEQQFGFGAFNIARGLQNSSQPLSNYWGWYYNAIRDCNIFLENINKVPDLDPWERDQWIAETKFLKAYYHFYLIKMYGPVPIVKENLPIDAGIDQVRVYRDPVDEGFDYVIQLLDEAIHDLPKSISNPTEELGRINKAIAYAFKAKVLVTAASPLFNGNKDQATLIDNKGRNLFNTTYDATKWQKAVDACEEAIDFCTSELGMKLYTYPGNPQYKLSDVTMREMTLRNAFTEKWNSEIIWANTQSVQDYTQRQTMPKLDTRYIDAPAFKMLLGAPLKVVEQFYSHNGVPINEDKDMSWDYSERYQLQKATAAYKRHIREGSQTVKLHFDREPRFYAYVGFDTGVWYGQSKENDSDPNSLFYVAARKGQPQGKKDVNFGPITSYYPKKYVHFQTQQTAAMNYTIVPYPWPILRLSDLYLLYAEALNEASDSGANRIDAMRWLDMVRDRAGLKGVAESWTAHSTNPNKFNSQSGLRDIIQQERLIELCFEGHRFWDLRRWKKVEDYYKIPFLGWDISQSSASGFYRQTRLVEQKFAVKDYLWPIENGEITTNRNIIQNIGW